MQKQNQGTPIHAGRSVQVPARDTVRINTSKLGARGVETPAPLPTANANKPVPTAQSEMDRLMNLWGSL